MYTEKLIPGSMVAENPLDELVKIADRHNMEYVIATHGAFVIFPIKVCTICIPFWKEDEFESDIAKAEAANAALGEAMKFVEANSKYRIGDVSATSFEIEQTD